MSLSKKHKSYKSLFFISSLLVLFCLLITGCTTKVTVIDTTERYQEYIAYQSQNSALLIKYKKEDRDYYYFESKFPLDVKGNIVAISKKIIKKKDNIEIKEGDNVKNNMFIVIDE